MRRFLTFVIASARAIALDQAFRRRALFGMTLGALFMLFLGVTAFARPLAEHLWLFLIYWLACAWLTISIALVAGYDLLVVITAGRRARRDLERSLAAEQNFSTKSGPSNTSPDP